ncbi:hypothetical protein HY494_01515 [Candidatus Woesearchaeota archaeon]|nr:hypothetical protein [Candidatus Woesearchaeota archaeon]
MIDFNALGYQTGEINLPGLDIIIPLNPNQYFRNDGLVSDIEAHTEKVLQQFGMSYNRNNSPKQAYGRQVGIGNQSVKSSTIFLRDTDDVTNLFIFGHEATHALIHLRLEQYLLHALRAERFLLNPFEKYDNEEQIAHIGGLLGLYKAKKLDFVNKCKLSSLVDDLRNSYQ